MSANRRLAAIMVADVVGYARLMEADETGTLAALKERRKSVLEPVVKAHGGRIVKVMGDGVLVVFGSAVNAVEGAIELQKKMAEANASAPDDRAIVLRIGINLGDVIGEGSDIYGEGVNIAARLESLAEPAGILISGTIYDHIGGNLGGSFSEFGAQELKNIKKPVRLYRFAKAGPQHAAIQRGSVGSGKLSIAVLPFVSMSSEADQKFFSDGITEDIITELSRFRQLRVMSRNSSFRYRGSDIDMVKAGRELGVHYLVEGSVRRVGNRIRITAQLIDAATGSHVWAERYDRDQEEIFTVQDLVVRAIAVKAVERLQSAGAESAKRKPPASLAAYEYVLRADALAWHDPATKVEARRYCEKAIEIDPTYARAYAHLSQILGNLAEESANREELEKESFELAKKAVALDENDSRCHGVLGDAYLQQRAFPQAEHHYRRALELNPNHPSLLGATGSAYSYLGDHQRGLDYFAQARSLDPHFDPSWHAPVLGMVYFNARRYDEAIAGLLRSTVMPEWVRSYLAAAYAHAGQESDARQQAEQILKAAPHYSARRFLAGEPFKRAEDQDHLLDGLRKAGLPE